MAIPTYVIRGGVEGRERLRVLARVMWPTTDALLSRVGIEPDGRCLDIGCGGGDVTVELARRVPDGSVVGVDLDDTKIELARAEVANAGVGNVEFRVEDVMQPPVSGDRFDVVYARFILTHVPNSEQALANMCARLAPGGALVVEDIDCSGHFCHPPSTAFDRYVDLYSKAARARGCDPDIGRRLPALLRDAGLDDVSMHVVQPAGTTGEVKLIGPMTLEAIADAVLAADLATPDELGQLVDELYAVANTDGTLLSLPRIVQAWGRRARMGTQPPMPEG
jgi:SAM-dependent methyltransferase